MSPKQRVSMRKAPKPRNHIAMRDRITGVFGITKRLDQRNGSLLILQALAMFKRQVQEHPPLGINLGIKSPRDGNFGDLERLAIRTQSSVDVP